VERTRRKAVALGAHPGERRHRHAMRELVRTDLQRFKQRLEFHVGPGCLWKEADHIARAATGKGAAPTKCRYSLGVLRCLDPDGLHVEIFLDVLLARLAAVAAHFIAAE